MGLLIFSCGRKEQENEEILLRYGDKTLTYHEIVDMIPDGLTGPDSISMFHALVEGWIKSNVLSDFAEERLYDTNAIDARAQEYRNNLIVLEYLSRMRDSKTPKIEESRVKDYYDRHRKDLKLEVPLIRGVFMKINSDSKGVEEIKKLLISDNAEDIDKLEKDWIDKALEYNYFRDKWIDWETVKTMIPHRFGDPDSFLKENNYVETTYGDCTYFLYIAEWLPSGEEQPYEFARNWIINVMTQGDLNDYEDNLVKSLVDKSIKDKKLQIIGYDPIKHQLLETKVKEKDENPNN